MHLQIHDIIWLPVFLLIISILVAAHEYGHYLFARIFKMGIEEFAIGFGKRPLWIIGRKRVGIKLTPAEIQEFEWRKAHREEVQSRTLPFEGRGGIEPKQELIGDTLYEETAFTIRPWPIGGFVRIKGMQPEEDGSEVNIPGGFYSKPPWQRLLVLFAGPLFSVAAGVVLLMALYSIGGVERFSNAPVVFSTLQQGPADKAGLKPGDRFLSVDGKPVSTYYEVVRYVRDGGGKPVTIAYRRGDKTFTTIAQPELDKSPTPVVGPDMQLTSETRLQYKLKMGIERVRVHVGVAEAMYEAVKVPVDVVAGLAGVFAKPSTFEENVGGPATMAMMTRESVKQGPYYIFWLAAMLSISVGILNLLPWPPLDGGQMLLAFVEMLRRGRRLSIQVQGTVAAVGLALVAVLTLSVIFVDLKRFLPGGKEEKPAAAKQQTPPPNEAKPR